MRFKASRVPLPDINSHLLNYGIMSIPFLSICIPSYNRPEQLKRLLESVDCRPGDVEIVVCEDFAPKRPDVRACIEEVKEASVYTIVYSENETNLGFDGNIRRLVECANGEYVMFMGDDDLFIPHALDHFLGFLKENRDKKYVLRSYTTVHENGRKESYRYLPGTSSLPPGEDTVAWLFKRSVTICGFTISREEAAAHATADLDGTLLYQIYLMGQVCMEHESVYCDIPVAQMVQSYRQDKPMFGSSEAEKTRYTPGTVSQDNSVNFTAAYFEVAGYLDKVHGTHITERVRTDLSKYSYPFLSIQRKRGVKEFLEYARRLDLEFGLGKTTYFHLYKWGLVIFGEYWCDRLIVMVKRAVGHTPNL